MGGEERHEGNILGASAGHCPLSPVATKTHRLADGYRDGICYLAILVTRLVALLRGPISEPRTCQQQTEHSPTR